MAKKTNQRQKILMYINTFGSITTMDAFLDLGITKLTSRISDIRSKDGITVQDKWEKRKNRFGESVRYKRYWI